MSKKHKYLSAFLVLCLAALACNLPGGQPQAAVEAGPTFTPTPASAFTPTPTAAVAAVQDCSPTVTALVDANVRSGPDSAVYGVVGNLPLGGTAPVVGRNANGTWWYIQFAGGLAWIAGSVTSATCIPSTLPVVAAPPPPAPPPVVPSNTPEPGSPPVPPVGLTFVYDGPLFEIDPGIFFIPSPTPTLIDFDFDFDFGDLPCPWWGCP